MEKISGVYEEEYIYDIDILIGETAYIKTPDGRCGLLNIKTNKIVGSLGEFSTLYSTHEFYYFQEGKSEVCEEATVKRSSKTERVLRFYDAKNNKMVFDGWPIVHTCKRDYDLVILRNPNTGKYHIFDKKAYLKSRNIFDIGFNMGFDNVEYLYDRYGESVCVVTKDNRKGIYFSNYGIKVPIEYDNIERMDNVTVLTKVGKKYFLRDYSDSKISSPYNDVTVEKKNSAIIYGKTYGGVSVFIYDKPMFSGSYSKVEFIREIEVYGQTESIFKVTSGFKEGIISCKFDKNTNSYKTSTILECTYDKIEVKYNDYFLYKNGKIGLYKRDNYGKHVVPPLYDKIEELYNDYYAFYNGELCNIAHIENHSNHEVSWCKIVDSYNDDAIIVYVKAGSYGIFASNRNCGKYKIYGYDKITNKTGGYFELEKFGKKGMWFCHKVLLNPIYDSIQINGDNKYGSTCTNLRDAEEVYLGLEKDNTFTLAKCNNSHYSDNNVTEIEQQAYNEMEFLPNIIVAKKTSFIINRSKNKTYVYNYNGELLKTFDGNVNISYVSDKKNSLYLVDGTYYIFKDGNFEKASAGKSTLYATAYESEYGTIVVNSYNEQLHDKRCNKIESLSIEEVNEKILTYANSREGLLDKYPKLVRKK